MPGATQRLRAKAIAAPRSASHATDTLAAHSKSYFISGYSLLELLLCLALVSIVAGFTAPSLRDFVEQARADSIQQKLRKAIYRTRSAAIYSKQIVSLCPFGDGACGSEWARGLMVFTDRNNNGIIDDNDALLEIIDLDANDYELAWRASARKNFLRYSPTGMARAFGRFTLCAKSGNLRLARSIVVNRQGRLRTYKDRNNDGVVEDIDGRRPDCPR